MKMERSVDLAIIGAGTAGISAFKEASKVTNNIVIIDHGPLGTTCARVGCMPSKVLLQVANQFYDRIHFSKVGIQGSEKIKIDIRKVMQYVRQLRDYFSSGMVKYLESLGNHFIYGKAELVELNVIKVNNQIIFAKKIIIATGSNSIIRKEWQPFLSSILTSENIFEQESFLDTIAVIGAGPIGLELGQALSRLNIKIAVFHSHEFIGKLSDPVVNEAALKIFKEEFPLYTGNRAIIENDNGTLLVSNNNQSFAAKKMLAAIGKKPNLSGLNLDNLGLPMNKSGIPIYDRGTMQIGNLPIFIAGDVDGDRPLLHEAADDGRIAGHNAIRNEPHCFQRRTPLILTFTQPNIAIVGQSYHSLKDKDIIIGEVHFEDQGRARIMSQNKGVLRIYADRNGGKLLGAEMIAPAGEHLAHLLAWSIQREMTVFDLLEMPFYHPVIEEGIRTALYELVKQIPDKVESFYLAMCDSEAIANLC